MAKLTSNAYNDQGLSSEERKHNCSKNRGKQNLIDAEALVCLFKHVQGESEGRQDTAAIVSTLLRKNIGERNSARDLASIPNGYEGFTQAIDQIRRSKGNKNVKMETIENRT